MILGAARAALYTPIDTSALLNSQFREIVTDGAVITGRVVTRPTMPFMFMTRPTRRFSVVQLLKKNSSLWI
jgi:hypothetical protein